MEVSEQSKGYRFETDEEDQDFCGTAEFDSNSATDDSDEDPSYEILEETHSKLSELSIKKKPRPSMVDVIDIENEGDGAGIVHQELDEIDKKSFEEVGRMIEAGQVEKLKVDPCKVYLRKNGLRLTGNKSTLIQRIKSLLSFVLYNNGFQFHAGDACTGDIVLFEQNVYEMFNIASRSASGPPCGTRIIAGRIVKESYGASKQQHTFTIEVLWSKGEKPLPPLHPLLIKGRNLYRLKTLRQKWEYEGEREKILTEKHFRGSLARSNREARIKQKEMKNMLKANRILTKESNTNQSQFSLNSAPKPSLQSQQFGLSVNLVKPGKQAIESHQMKLSTEARRSDLSSNFKEPVIQPASQKASSSVYHVKETTKLQTKNTNQDKYLNHTYQNLVGCRSSSDTIRTFSDTQKVQQIHNNLHANNERPHFYLHDHQSHMNQANGWPDHRRPLTSINHFPPMSPPRRQDMKQKLCRYYAQGRCYYGDNCKYSHQIREESVQRREERLPWDPRMLDRLLI
ncbi:hypothetical protein UlMin_015875 [Ulmus minor]